MSAYMQQNQEKQMTESLWHVHKSYRRPILDHSYADFSQHNLILLKPQNKSYKKPCIQNIGKVICP